jgi:hypothetical protein
MRARDNPLATDRVLAIRYRPQGWTWDDLLARLEAMRYRAAVVGPKGTGKTTLLEDLSARLEGRGFRCRLIRLSAADQRLDPSELESAGRGEVILLDGAEQLPAWRWLWVRFRTRHAGGLVVTTHRPGRLPTLVHTRTTPRLLGGIVADLLPAPPDDRRIDALYHRHAGNLRDALRELYDDFAAAPPAKV